MQDLHARHNAHHNYKINIILQQIDEENDRVRAHWSLKVAQVGTPVLNFSKFCARRCTHCYRQIELHRLLYTTQVWLHSGYRKTCKIYTQVPCLQACKKTISESQHVPGAQNAKVTMCTTVLSASMNLLMKYWESIMV